MGFAIITLVKFRSSFHDALYVRPEFEKDVPMFKHCTGGYDRVQNKEFNRKFKPVFHGHGFIIRIIDRSRRK